MSNLSKLQTMTFPEKFQPLFTPSRYKAAKGGRGSAKSHSFAKALLIKGAQKPLRILCTREIQNSIKSSVKRLLDDQIQIHKLGNFYSSTDTELRGKNGTLFIFAGLRSNVETVRSLEGIDIAWIEEANTVSKNSLEVLIPTIRKPKSEIWASWNPRFPTDPIDSLFSEINRPPSTIMMEANYCDNPWFPEVLKQEMEWDKQRDFDKYVHIWLGGYRVHSEARVFRNFKVEDFDTPTEARFYFGADWGYASDPTVLIRCFIEGKTLFIDKEAYALGCEIDETPALFDLVPGARLWPIRADSARPETISYMRKHGFPRIESASKGPNSVMEGVEFIKNYDVVIHPTCKHTADEFMLYNYQVDKLTGEVLPKLEDKKNHTIDSVRYALEKVRRQERMNLEQFAGPIILDQEFY